MKIGTPKGCPPFPAAVPERDELYDRRTDRKQLHNVINEYPEVAAELLNTLGSYLRELHNN